MPSVPAVLYLSILDDPHEDEVLQLHRTREDAIQACQAWMGRMAEEKPWRFPDPKDWEVSHEDSPNGDDGWFFLASYSDYSASVRSVEAP